MWRQIVLGFGFTLFSPAMAVAVDHSPVQLSNKSQRHISTFESLTAMPLKFTENRGQWDEGVKFRASAGKATMWFTTEGICYQFVRSLPEVEQLVVRAIIVGVNSRPHVVGEDMTPHKCHYFIGGDPGQWHTSVPSYGAIVFEDIYDDIDLKYYSDGTQLEYDFLVSPCADVKRIEIEYDGI